MGIRRECLLRPFNYSKNISISVCFPFIRWLFNEPVLKASQFVINTPGVHLRKYGTTNETCWNHFSIPCAASQDGNSGRSFAVFFISVPCWSTQKHTDASHCTGAYFPSGVQWGMYLSLEADVYAFWYCAWQGVWGLPSIKTQLAHSFGCQAICWWCLLKRCF